MSDFMNTIQGRRSIRRYQEQDIPDDILTQSARSRPMGTVLGQHPVLEFCRG